MKTKILFVLICCLCLVFAIHFASIIFIPQLNALIDFNRNYFIFQITLEIVIFIALIFLAFSLLKIIKTGYFQSEVYKFLKYAGLLLVIAATGDLIYSIEAMFNAESPELFMQRCTTDFLLLILGLSSLLVSDIIKNGLTIKSENDLTI